MGSERFAARGHELDELENGHRNDRDGDQRSALVPGQRVGLEDELQGPHVMSGDLERK